MRKKRLSELKEGRAATVTGVAPSSASSVRLTELGFTEGASAKCLYSASDGYLRAYLIRGVVIALRRDDAELVYIDDEHLCADGKYRKGECGEWD